MSDYDLAVQGAFMAFCDLVEYIVENMGPYCNPVIVYIMFNSILILPLV